MTEQNYKTVFIVYFIIFGIIISLVGGLVGYKIQLNSMKDEITTKANEEMLNKEFMLLKPVIKEMDNTVTALAINKTIKNFVIEHNEHVRSELENIFLAVASAEDMMMQARLIDKNGMEIVRVDRTTQQDKPFIVDKSKLQDKSNRDYFQTISKMTTEKIWHSKLDLNIEHGKIEVPYRPTIRVAMPIFKDGKFYGTVIINVLIQNLLDALSTSSDFGIFMVDKDGYYILHHNPIYSFNKYTGTRRLISDDFPKDSFNILAKEPKCTNCFVYPIDNILNNDDKALLILKPKEAYKDAILKSKLITTSIVVLVSILISFFMAFFASIHPSRLQQALIVANNELKRFSEIIDKYVVTATTKKDAIILDVSHAFAEASGYSKAELIGKPINIIRHPENDKSFYQKIWDTILNQKEWNGEIKNRNKDGEDYWLEQNIVPIQNEGKDDIDKFVSIGVDITAKKVLEELSSKDKLTGIYNRRKLDEFINFEVEVAKRHENHLSVIIIDIDHFKNVNDTFGHQVGDMVLAKTTEIISKILRKSDLFGRYGGEEFLIICPETTADEAFVLAEKIRESIEAFKYDVVGNKTISQGVAELMDEDDANSLISKADQALYKAKNTGRNKVVIYNA